MPYIWRSVSIIFAYAYKQYVEFGGLDDDTSDAGGDDWSSHESDGVHLPDPNADKANAQHGKSLEVLLASKNKRILEELTRFRVSLPLFDHRYRHDTRNHTLHQILHTSLEESLKSTQSELDTARTELSKQKSLNEKLETDLLALDNRSTKPSATNDKAGVDDALAGLGLDLGLDNATHKRGGSASSTTRSTPIPFTPSADTSILPIVTSQRDRFRARNAELEEVRVFFLSTDLLGIHGAYTVQELRRQFHTISELRSEIKSLQSDNLKLYEKVRYMQSYRESSSVSQLDPLPGTSKSHREGRSRTGGALDGNNEDEVELGKWRQRYEETMNPFEAFRGRVRAFHVLGYTVV